MYPIKFKEANRVLLRPSNMTDDECKPLWVYTDRKECVSCWKLTWMDRIKALLFGKVWLIVLSGDTQPPVALMCEDSAFVKGGE